MEPRPPPCSQSEVSWGIGPGPGAAAAVAAVAAAAAVAVAGHQVVGSAAGGGSADLQRPPVVPMAPSSHPGSVGVEGASLHTPGTDHWVVLGALDKISDSASSAERPSLEGATWDQHALLMNGGGTGGPVGWG